MRTLFCLVVLISVLGCQKETSAPVEKAQGISSDSIVQILQSQWKFKTPEYSNEVYYILNNWNEWREMTHALEQKPAKSLPSIQKKVTDLVAQVEKLPNTIPDAYRQTAIISRINLLQTHVYNLDMLLELNPVPYKDITPIFTQIQKDLTSISNQFQEVVTKNRIPKEVGEDAVRVKVDTVKRATLNAIPTE